MDYEKEINELKTHLRKAYDKIYGLISIIEQMIKDSELPEEIKREYLDKVFRI